MSQVRSKSRGKIQDSSQVKGQLPMDPTEDPGELKLFPQRKKKKMKAVALGLTVTRTCFPIRSQLIGKQVLVTVRPKATAFIFFFFLWGKSFSSPGSSVGSTGSWPFT